MQKRQSNYERIILVLLAVLAIAGAGWLISLTTGFAGTLEPKRATSPNESVPPPMQQVEDAIKRAIEVPKPWVAPVRNNKAVPLNKSVLLVLKGEEIIDMFREDVVLRPPMTNAYLRENNLEWKSPNVGELDPDGDGFTNLEEFDKGTKPRDAQNYPPITDKLFMVERISKDYRLVLRNSSGQVSLLDEPKKKTAFLDLTKVGTEPAQFFGGNGDRFKTVKFERKVVPDPRVGEKDVSELTIEEIVTKKQIVLVMGVEQNLAEYSVRFEFRLKQIIGLAPVGQDGTFRIPGYEGTTYKVLDIKEDSAVIAPVKADGTLDKEVLIKKG
jgi:hypothetical protein